MLSIYVSIPVPPTAESDSLGSESVQCASIPASKVKRAVQWPLVLLTLQGQGPRQTLRGESGQLKISPQNQSPELRYLAVNVQPVHERGYMCVC